jgi:hypothetical protein
VPDKITHITTDETAPAQMPAAFRALGVVVDCV